MSESDNDFLTESDAPDIIDVKAKDVPDKEEKKSPAENAAEAPSDVPNVKIPVGMEPMADLITTECELLTKRGQTLEALANRGVIPNKLLFDIVDEAIIAAYIRRVADFFEIPPEAIISSMEISNAKAVERQLMEREQHEEADDADEYAFASYR